jgi:hypothetical protein
MERKKNKAKSYYNLSKYQKNLENPFLKDALDVINNNIARRYKTASNTDECAILQAFDPKTGEALGHTQFIRQIEVDEDKFAKVYLSQFSTFFELKPQAIRVFGYIMTKLIPKPDMFTFLIHEALEYTAYKSEDSIRIGLGQLVSAKIIARGPADVLFFINPMVVFNGDRVTFANSYIKKKKKAEITNQSQPELPFNP